MKLLLDTQAFIWAAEDNPRLGATAQALISQAATVLVSVATIWEIAIKAGTGRVIFPVEEFASALESMRFELLGIAIDHAIEAGNLPPIHKDPFDRMLIAQARLERLSLMTSDRIIGRYDLELLDATV